MKQPNILLIMSDQHSARALGALGNPVVRTPNLDRLAREGVLFRNAYTNSPICCPARMAFMTGRYPHHNKAIDNGSTLSSEEPTFAHALTRAGYETVICSRMHFHGPDQHHGFERRLASEINNPIYYPPDRLGVNRAERPRFGGVRDDDGEDDFVPRTTPGVKHDDHVLAKACEYLEQGSWGERPFLLTASFVGPHPAVKNRPFTPHYG